MALITKLHKNVLINKFLSNNSVYLSCNANYSKDIQTWDYLWRAGEAPRTEEERKKAAEKYNVHPKQYEPHDPTMFGDYPKLPLRGPAAEDPYYPWDFPNLKRNFGEPVHIHYPTMSEDRYPYGVRKRYTLRTLLTVYFLFMGTMYGLFHFVGKKFYWFQPVMAKQYPKPGVTHYTFEPAS